MNFSESPEFQKDVKALSKTVRTLRADLERVHARIEPLYVPVRDVNITTYRNLFFDNKRATILRKSDGVEAIKMRLDTDTPTMRGKLRIVIVAVIASDTVTFVEVYSKSNKSSADTTRYKRYFKS